MEGLPEHVCEGALTLRRFRPDDGAALAAAVRESVASIAPWLPWCHADYGRADADRFIRMADAAWQAGGPFDMALLEDDVLAGSVRLRPLADEPGVGNLGYWVRLSRQRRGLALRAAQMALPLAFEGLALQRLEVVAALDNVASRRVAERLGARFEGVARHRLRLAQGPADAAIYALLPADLR